MKEWTEDEIEQFIRDNKDRFDIARLDPNHENKFLLRLSRKFKKIISIVPHIVKVAIVTVIVFIASIVIWNNFIRKDRHEITLKQKIENILTFKK